MNTSLMQPQSLVQLEELPEPAPDQWTGRQTVAALAPQHHCQFVSPAPAPTAPHGPSSACPAQALHALCQFCLCLGLPTCMLSQINTWQEYSLYSITLMHLKVALGGFTPLLNCNKVGCCRNATVTSDQFCFARAPWKIWEVNTRDSHYSTNTIQWGISSTSIKIIAVVTSSWIYSPTGKTFTYDYQYRQNSSF